MQTPCCSRGGYTLLAAGTPEWISKTASIVNLLVRRTKTQAMTGKERSSRVGVLGDLMPSLFHGNLAKHLHIIIYLKKKKKRDELRY